MELVIPLPSLHDVAVFASGALAGVVAFLCALGFALRNWHPFGY